MQRGIKLFRISGVDIFLDWSLLIIFFLIGSSLAIGLFPVFGRLRGLLRREDIVQWLSLHGDLPGSRMSAPQSR